MEKAAEPPVKVPVAPDGRIVEVNRAWEELWSLKSGAVKDYNILRDEQLVKKGIMAALAAFFLVLDHGLGQRGRIHGEVSGVWDLGREGSIRLPLPRSSPR